MGRQLAGQPLHGGGDRAGVSRESVEGGITSDGIEKRCHCERSEAIQKGAGIRVLGCGLDRRGRTRGLAMTL